MPYAESEKDAKGRPALFDSADARGAPPLREAGIRPGSGQSDLVPVVTECCGDLVHGLLG